MAEDDRMSFEEIIEEAKRIAREEPERARAKAAQDRADFLAALAKLPLEERIRRLEEWVYDYKPEYVPEPRFK